MSSVTIVSRIDPGDKSWLKREARRAGVSMAQFVRLLVREKRERTERREKPSDVFRRHFGPEHGVQLPPRGRYGYKPPAFVGKNEQ